MQPLNTTVLCRTAAAAVLGLAAAACASAQTLSVATPVAAAAALFDPIARVVMHPRCLNCHQVEAPRQTELGVRHTQGVLRGRDGQGAPGMPCASCHQGSNSADGRVPGAKHWQLAPLSMQWQGLKPAELCRQLKDPARNGNRRTAAQLIKHMATEPLVLWAWAPGSGRSLPPLSHADFLTALQAWADLGMPCPP